MGTLSPATARALIALFVGVHLAGMALAFDGGRFVILLSLLSGLVCLVPLQRRDGQLDLFDPTVVVFLAVVFGFAPKALGRYAFGWINDETMLELTRTPLSDAVMLRGGLAVFGASCAISFGVILTRRARTQSQLRRAVLSEDYVPPDWGRAARPAAFILLTLGIIGFLLFARNEGGFSLNGLSGKRFSDLEGGSSERFATLSFLWFRMAGLTRVAFLAVLIGKHVIGIRKSIWTEALYWTALVVSVALAIFSNNRSALLLLAIDWSVIKLYSTRSVSIARLAGNLVVLLGFSSALLMLRGGSRTLAASLAKTLLGRDFFDVTKIGVITGYRVDDQSLLGGESLIGWITAPFPQSLGLPQWRWAELGQIVFSDIYGLRGNAGIPPTLVGEMYLNFGTVAILPGCLVFGVLLGLLHRRFKSSTSLGFQLVYITAMPRFVLYGLTGGIGLGITRAFFDLAPLLLIPLLNNMLPRKTSRPATNSLGVHGRSQGTSTPILRN